VDEVTRTNPFFFLKPYFSWRKKSNKRTCSAKELLKNYSISLR
jgi:hypothetical protein